MILKCFLLQRQDEKYLLKFHTGSNSIVPGGTKDEVEIALSEMLEDRK